MALGFGKGVIGHAITPLHEVILYNELIGLIEKNAYGSSYKTNNLMM